MVGNGGGVGYYNSPSNITVRPVVTLLPSIDFESGDGSYENPYYVSVITPSISN